MKFGGEVKNPRFGWVEVSERNSSCSRQYRSMSLPPNPLPLTRPHLCYRSSHNKRAREELGMYSEKVGTESGTGWDLAFPPVLWVHCKCHQNSQRGTEARTLDHGAATVCGSSHPRFSVSKLYLERVKETCTLPEHKRRRKREKIAITWRHLALNFNQLFPNPSPPPLS